MADITLTPESKINITIANEDKPAALTWADADWTWDEETGTWEQPEPVLAKDAKINITLNNENKN